MTELSGTLDGLGLPAVVRFLNGVKKTGALGVALRDWHGKIYFEEGRVTGASLGSRSGLTALDALVEAFPGASFDFDSTRGPEDERTIQLSQEGMLAHLDEVVTRIQGGARALPSAEVVPELIAPNEPDGVDPLPLERGALQTLMLIDGRRTVGAIVTQRATFDVLWHIVSLVELGLIRLRPGAASSGATARPPRTPERAVEAEAETEHQCPKLGFENDPSHSFTRPTRLHRCFAAGAPLPLSLDQQRELCLSDQSHTCPRLTTPDDPRIVRLPFAARPQPASDREPVASTQTGPGSAPQPTRRRAYKLDAQDSTSRPTPLRATIRANGAGSAGLSASAVIDRPVPELREPIAVQARTALEPPEVAPTTRRIEGLAERRIGNVPIGIIAIGVAVLTVLAVLVYLILPQADSLLGEDSIDPSALPNTSLVAAGTPVSVLPRARATPGTAVSPASQPVAEATAPPPQPSATTVPTPSAVEPAAVRTLLDEHFSSNGANWPINPQAQITNGAYRLATRQAGQFVAIGAPIASLPADVAVSATFHKVGGPPGGGFGIILRDQQGTVRDGISQDGRYYVLELGDKGEVGIWRREADHWVDLLPWQHADAVKPGTASNDLVARAIGNTLSLSVNGSEVATRTDHAFAAGSAGLFVGGDGNVIGLDHFAIQTP